MASDGIRGYARRNPSMSGIGGDVGLWANRAGSIVTLPEISALIAAGYGFNVTVGSATTPIVGGGQGTVFDQDQPDFYISVPTGTAIMPFSVKIQAELPADQDGDVQEILLAVDRTAAQATAAGGGTAEVAFNLRTDNPRASLCTIESSVNSNLTNPTLGIELARSQEVTNIVTAGISQGFLELRYEPKVCPILVGPCQLIGYWGGTQAMSAFAQIHWIEMPEELNMFWGGS